MKPEQIAEFKRLLFAGPVQFTFTKSDGTPRPTLGTMCKDLLPKSEGPIEKAYVCSDIQWDTDEVLPKTVIVKNVPADLEGEELDDYLNEALERNFKFCTNGFSVAEKPKRKLKEGQILFYDLENKGFRSCILEKVTAFEAKA